MMEFYASDPPGKGAGGIMFSGISLMRNLKNPWVNFYHTWPRGAPWRVDELMRFLGEIRPRSKVKGQWTWSKYAIFKSLPRNLKNPWVDFHQTWHRGAQWRVDELIRFWARSAQGQRSKVNELGLHMLFLPCYRENLKNPWVDFHQTWYRSVRSRWSD